MANKQDYLARLQVVVQESRKCGAVYRQTVPVHEVFRGKTAWRGEVEVFDLNGHAKAKRCYAWSHREGPQGKGERFVAVLELPPVKDPKSAVRAAIVSEIGKSKQKPQ